MKVNGLGVKEAVRQAVNLIGGLRVRAGSHVVIKPNICHSKNPFKMVLTDPSIVEAVVEIVKERTNRITIVESDNIAGTAEKRLAESGYLRWVDEWDVNFVNLSEDEVEEHKIEGLTLKIPKTMLEADYVVNLPKMKTSGPTLVTLSMKNMFGVLANRNKKSLHKYLDRVIPYICKVVRQDLIVVDGVVAMEGNGPLVGNPVDLGIVVAGDNPVAVDSVCTRIMGLEPEEVGHIVNGWKMGLGEMKLEKIRVLGESISSVQRRFEKPYTLKSIIKSLKPISKIFMGL